MEAIDHLYFTNSNCYSTKDPTNKQDKYLTNYSYRNNNQYIMHTV